MASDKDAVTVVVVDDERSICEMIARLLSRNGYEASPLFDGRAALEHVVELGDLLVDQEQRQVLCGGKPCDLTPLEYRLLLHLARHANQVVTHQALAKATRGQSQERWEAREFTKQYIRNIRRKIGDSAQSPRFIHTVHSQGYRLALL